MDDVRHRGRVKMLLKIIAVMLFVVSSGCSQRRADPKRAERPETPGPAAEVSWPESIDMSRIEIEHRGATKVVPFDRKKDPNLISKQYLNWDKKKVLHSIGITTTIYYLKDKDVFYVLCDCQQGHVDGYQGPFNGDPRVILKAEE
jgi:hypothetical protein